MDKIIIDETAANLDISRINQAIPYLEEARAALDHVLSEANQTKGQTGKAIAEKSTTLIKRIDLLLNSLNETKKNIRFTVTQNQELDRAMASKIASQM